MVATLQAQTRIARFPVEGLKRRVADCPRCAQATPVPLGPYAAAVECSTCRAELTFRAAQPASSAPLFFAVAEQPAAQSVVDGGSSASGRELVLELRRSYIALWPIDHASGFGSEPVHTIDLRSEFQEVIVGLAASHAAQQQQQQQQQSLFGIVCKSRAPLLLRASSAHELALLTAAIGARRDLAVGLVPMPGAAAAQANVLWQGSARVACAAGAGASSALRTRAGAHLVLLSPARLLVFADADSAAPLRVFPLSPASHSIHGPRPAPAAAPAAASQIEAAGPTALPAAGGASGGGSGCLSDGATARHVECSSAGGEAGAPGDAPAASSPANRLGLGVGSGSGSAAGAAASRLVRVRIFARDGGGPSTAQGLPLSLATLELPTAAPARQLTATLSSALETAAASTRAALHSRRGRWLVVVTGASRGFGHAFAMQLAGELVRAHARMRGAAGAHDARSAGAAADAAAGGQGQARADGRSTAGGAQPGGAGGGSLGEVEAPLPLCCEGAHFLLLGRDAASLDRARQDLECRLRAAAEGEFSPGAPASAAGQDGPHGAAACPGRGGGGSGEWSVSTCSLDLSDSQAVAHFIEQNLEKVLASARRAASTAAGRGPATLSASASAPSVTPARAAEPSHLSLHLSSFSHALLLNNAAELPPLQPLATLPAAALAASLQLCALAPAALAAAFARHARLCAGSSETTVVHTSSLFAVEAARTWGAYCVGKAAADMVHRVLSLEGEADEAGGANGQLLPSLRTLNYAPGPLDTDMQAAVRASAGCDPQLAAQFKQLKESGQLVPPEASAAVLVRLLLAGRFESGAHLDYYDVC